MTQATQHNPQLDLVFEREVAVPKELIWQAWTRPELIKKWFTPAPWTTVGCEIDLRPGGLFYTLMRSPEGQEFPNTGCYLEVVANQRLVWTSALGPGFRPKPALPAESADSANCDFPFTVILTLAPQGTGTGTCYTAVALHRDEADRQKHEAMGFQDGWGKALDQLVALVKAM